MRTIKVFQDQASPLDALAALLRKYLSDCLVFCPFQYGQEFRAVCQFHSLVRIKNEQLLFSSQKKLKL